MIPLAVLWQYVKVFFGKHGLELHDISGQRSVSGLSLFAMSGSFHEMLGDRSHSSEVSWSELWEEAHKEELVSGLSVGAVCLRRRCHDLAKWLSHYLIFLFFFFSFSFEYCFSFSFLLNNGHARAS